MKNCYSLNFESKLNNSVLLRNVLSGSVLPYALYGGGDCARKILDFMQTEDLPLPKKIFDRNSTARKLFGIPIMKPSRKRLAGISTILLATEVWQESMKEDIKAISEEIRVIDLLKVNYKARKRTQLESQKGTLPSNQLNIAVWCDGGLGDMININAWLKEFRKLFTCPICLDVFTYSREQGIAVFKNTGIVHKIFSARSYYRRHKTYDLAFLANWTIKVTHFDRKRAARFDKRLPGYVARFNAFWRKNEQYLHFKTQHMLYSLCVYRGMDRWDLLGAANIFQFSQNTRPFLPISDSALLLLDQAGLTEKPYIVIGSGCTTTREFARTPVKAWPGNQWNALVKLIKARFPRLMIVQIGAGQYLQHVSNVDVDLAGLTSVEEMKVVLKNALFLIDTDSGAVHINNALGGQSAVLWGSSFKEVHGYKKNINISANVCRECIWIYPDWPEHCALEQDPPKCMNSITPEMVFEHLDPVLNSLTKPGLRRLDRFLSDQKPLNERIMDVLSARLAQNSRIAVLGNEVESLLPDIAGLGSSAIYFTLNASKISEQRGDPSSSGIDYEFGSPLSLPAKTSSFDAMMIDMDPSWGVEKTEFVKREAARVLKLDGVLVLVERSRVLATPSLAIFQKYEEPLFSTCHLEPGQAA